MERRLLSGHLVFRGASEKEPQWRTGPECDREDNSQLVGRRAWQHVDCRSPGASALEFLESFLFFPVLENWLGRM